MEAADSVRSLSDGGLVMRNFRLSAYQLVVEPVDGEIIGLASSGNLVFISVARQGVHVHRVNDGDVTPVKVLSRLGATCHDLVAGTHHIAYTTEEPNGSVLLCVHSTVKIDDGDVTEPIVSRIIQRRSPLTLHSALGLLFVGGAAWTSSWTSASNDEHDQMKGVNEKYVVAVSFKSHSSSQSVVAIWEAVEHSVSLMQTQTHQSQTLLAVADTRSGILVYDIGNGRLDGTRTSSEPFESLYRIDVEHVRSFRMVGACVAVFHRFEPNVSFWNVADQRTVLCINVQDQTRQLTEELDDTDDYVIPPSDEDDHVTSVTSLPVDGGADYLLVYGTVSGCVFGMSVRRRSSVFSIPCPIPVDQHRSTSSAKSVTFGALNAISVLLTGQMMLSYEGYDSLTMMNFNIENPPDRAPPVVA